MEEDEINAEVFTAYLSGFIGTDGNYVIEEKLMQSLKNERAYICSPLHAETDEKMQANTRNSSAHK